MHKKGKSRLSVGNFLSHSTEKFRRVTLLFFEKILVSKIFMHGRGELLFCHFFLSHSAEKVRGEPFCVSEKSWYRKILWIRGVEGGGVTIRNFKNIWHDRHWNPGPTALELCCPSPTAVNYF